MKAHLKYLLLLGSFFVGIPILPAQYFLIHTDQDYYISGENISYCIYPNKNIYTDSMLIMVALYSKQSTLVSNQIHRLTDASISGIIKTNHSLKEGNYTLVCYAVWDHSWLDSLQVLFSFKYIPVFNDLDQPPQMQTSQAELNHLNDISQDSLSVSDLDHKKYHTYPIKLSSQNQPVHHPSFSVSINKINSLNEHQLDVNPVNDNKSPDLKDFVVRKKIILEGEVKDPATRKKVNEKYLTLYIAKTGSFQRITSTNGRIKSSIRDIKGNFSFQLLSLNPNQHSPLEFTPVDYLDKFGSVIHQAPDLIRNETMNYTLLQYTKRRLLENLFKGSTLSRKTSEDSIYSFLADKEYYIADFQDIKSLEEFIKEVMVDCSITTVLNDKKSLRLRNKDSRDLYRWPAWYLLNGFFRGDEDALLKFDISKIKKLALFNTKKTIIPQFDTLMQYSGIFSVSTYLQDEIPAYVHHSIGLSDPSSISQVAIFSKDGPPDLRTKLTWQTNITSSANGALDLPIPASDIRGFFLIRVMGKNAAGEFEQHQEIIRIK